MTDLDAPTMRSAPMGRNVKFHAGVAGVTTYWNVETTSTYESQNYQHLNILMDNMM